MCKIHVCFFVFTFPLDCCLASQRPRWAIRTSCGGNKHSQWKHKTQQSTTTFSHNKTCGQNRGMTTKGPALRSSRSKHKIKDKHALEAHLGTWVCSVIRVIFCVFAISFYARNTQAMLKEKKCSNNFKYSPHSTSWGSPPSILAVLLLMENNCCVNNELRGSGMTSWK